MKKILFSCLTILAVILTGCKTTEITPESAYKAGSSAGLATGYFVKLSNLDDGTKEALVNISADVATIIPTNTETFAQLWTPAISAKLNEYATKKNLSDNQKKLVMTTFNVVIDALDHLFVKNTKLKISSDVTLSAVNGFCTAFNSVMSPTQTFTSKMTYDVDSEMYMYLKAKFAK